jgi:hypothetical protein
LFWTVKAFVATSHFSQLRRDETERAIADLFIDAVGNYGLVLERANIRISPTCLMRLHVNVVEVPEGSWGAAGQNIDTVKISKLIRATGRPEGALELGRDDEMARLSYLAASASDAPLRPTARSAIRTAGQPAAAGLRTPTSARIAPASVSRNTAHNHLAQRDWISRVRELRL